PAGMAASLAALARPCSAIYLLSRVGRRKAKLKEHAMRTSQNTAETINTIGIDVGKNTFHLAGLDKRGGIVLQQKVTRHQLGRRLSNIPRCLIGMETCSGTHFIARQLAALGHDVRLIPAQYVKPFLKGTKTTTAMPRQSRKRCNDQPCTSCRSRRRSRWIYWPCTVCVRALSGSARVWPIKSAAFCLSAGSLCGKASCHYAKRCPKF